MTNLSNYLWIKWHKNGGYDVPIQRNTCSKKHYKEKLSVAVEEMIESGVEMNLIATYYRTLEELKSKMQNGFSKPYYAWK